MVHVGSSTNERIDYFLAIAESSNIQCRASVLINYQNFKCGHGFIFNEERECVYVRERERWRQRERERRSRERKIKVGVKKESV